MKAYFFLALCIPFSIQAQTTLYSDALGLPLGSANRIGNTTIYSDSMGLPLGSSQTIGNTTLYSDSLGLPAGSSYSPQPIQSGPSYQQLTPLAPIFPSSNLGM